MPSLLDPDNGLAVSGNNAINNANLYFFSWAALISVSLSLCSLKENLSMLTGLSD